MPVTGTLPVSVGKRLPTLQRQGGQRLPHLSGVGLRTLRPQAPLGQSSRLLVPTQTRQPYPSKLLPEQAVRDALTLRNAIARKMGDNNGSHSSMARHPQEGSVSQVRCKVLKVLIEDNLCLFWRQHRRCITNRKGCTVFSKGHHAFKTKLHDQPNGGF